VSITTMHDSKGLEIPDVFLIGMEEELLQHQQNLESAGLEEERRVDYVGITRAKRTLTVTYATKRSKYGEDMACEPSRFLNELPEESLKWEGKPGVVISEEEKMEHGNAQLANIKSFLKKS